MYPPQINNFVDHIILGVPLDPKNINNKYVIVYPYINNYQ